MSAPSIAITPAAGPVHATVRPPGSKSITNRALILAALAAGPSRLTGALDSEDTRVMIDSLRRLGIAVEVSQAGEVLEVAGCGGAIPTREAELFVANSGTTIRFLTAMVTLGEKSRYRLDGIERMRNRPIQDLLDTLGALGADVQSETGTGCPPVIVRAEGLKGGLARIRGDISSQYLSGVLMAAPYARRPVKLEVQGELVSQPYVQMTLDVMAAFGVEVATGAGLSYFDVPCGQYHGREYAIEPDASAASYFFAVAAITGGRVTVEGLSRNSLQGDVDFCQCLEKMGCRVTYTDDTITVEGLPLRGIDVNMNSISDTVQTLAAVALFAEGPTRVTGVAHNRHKETDRIRDLATELRKLGAQVDEQEDGLTITPSTLRAASIDTYNDHRMAMSLALVGLRQPGVVINDPGCTEKTYPHYFRDLAQVVNPA